MHLHNLDPEVSTNLRAKRALAENLDIGIEFVRRAFEPKPWPRCAQCERRYPPDGERHYPELCRDCNEAVADVEYEMGMLDPWSCRICRRALSDESIDNPICLACRGEEDRDR